MKRRRWMAISCAILFMAAISPIAFGAVASGQNQKARSAMDQENAGNSPPAIFASFAEDSDALQHCLVLAESIRTFGGSFAEAPIRIYLPEELEVSDAIHLQFDSLGVSIRRSTVPFDALIFYYARKVFAAAQAEREAAGMRTVLVWMDEDTVVLTEPTAFRLPDNVGLAYRPVMHNIIGSVYSEPPDEFWARLYALMRIPDEALFPMTTPADRQEIRAYFNAGLLVVRPERGVLQRWVEYFEVLYADSTLIDWSEKDRLKKIFLHQTALVGAVLNTLKRSEMMELSERYNYPLFFKEMFGAIDEFTSVDEIATLRYDIYFRDPAPDWHTKLHGPADRIEWLRVRLGRPVR